MHSQKPLTSQIFKPSDSLSQQRLNFSYASTGVAYSAVGYGLYNLWYKEYNQSSFHLFNDWNEWRNVDKMGHVSSAYIQSLAGYRIAKWSGVSDNKSIWYGVGLGTISQLGIEIMDGYSTEWGFSIPDMASNILGVGLFALQQNYWKDQKIIMKISNVTRSYPEEFILPSNGMGPSVSLQERAKDLYGTNYAQRFFKDYNSQTIWLSFDVSSLLLPNQNWPEWLNLAVGYGAENMFGGFSNSWQTNAYQYSLSSELYPRYSQFFLALDIDFYKIRTKSPFVNTFLDIINSFHIPSPTIEFNTLGEVHFHFFM